MQDIQAAVDFLRSKGCKKVGVIGFCMGGALSLASSVLVNNLNYLYIKICFYYNLKKYYLVQ